MDVAGFWGCYALLLKPSIGTWCGSRAPLPFCFFFFLPDSRFRSRLISHNLEVTRCHQEVDENELSREGCWSLMLTFQPAISSFLIPLWNPVHNLHSLELVWDHVCRCQEALSAPPTNLSSVIVCLIPAFRCPSRREKYRIGDPRVIATYPRHQRLAPCFSRASRTILQDIPFLMSFMRLPPEFPSRLPSLRPRTGDEGDRRGSEQNRRLLC